MPEFLIAAFQPKMENCRKRMLLKLLRSERVRLYDRTRHQDRGRPDNTGPAETKLQRELRLVREQARIAIL